MTATEIVPDDAALRVQRRGRVLEAMEAADIDILVVGRESNARYISGAPRLWTAGSRAFGPGCAVVRATGAVHLLSTWDEGVPDEIPHENLYGITFDTTNFVTVLGKLDGAATAKKVGIDGLTPSFSKLLPMAFPSAELVDGEQLVRRVRAVKSAEEIDAIRASVRHAEQALAAVEAALEPGITERGLTAVFMEAMASAGVTTPAGQDVAWITSPTSPWQRSSRDVAVATGNLVAFEAGVVAGGYAGELARTRRVGGDDAIDRDLCRRWDELDERLLASCRPGATGTDLLAAYDAAGVAPPPMPVARGLGLGFDLPLVTPELPRTAAEQRLEAGMVLVLSTYVWQEGTGALYGQEPLAITANGPELLSTHPFRDARSRQA